MNSQKTTHPNAKDLPRKEDRLPDQGKCQEQKSRELNGKTAGDRGVCEKQSSSQGSE